MLEVTTCSSHALAQALIDDVGGADWPGEGSGGLGSGRETRVCGHQSGLSRIDCVESAESLGD
jgi:hypothetical protein